VQELLLLQAQLLGPTVYPEAFNQAGSFILTCTGAGESCINSLIAAFSAFGLICCANSGIAMSSALFVSNWVFLQQTLFP